MQNKEKVLISIIVAVYNVNDYLQDCISSLLAQTYNNIEIILVDDGSTDGSSDTCDLAGKQDCRVRVVHKENGGLSDARNVGLSASNGEYVTFVDGDDVVSSRLVEYLFLPIAEGRADFSICSSVESLSPKQYLVNEGKTYNEVLYQSYDATVECLMGSKLTVSACGKLGRRDLWVRHPFPKGRVYEDLSTVPSLIYDAGVVASVQESLYGQVMRAGSITRSSSVSNKQYEDYYHAIRQNRELFACHDSKDLRLAFSVRELIELSRMIRLYSRIDKPNSESKHIFSRAKATVKSSLFREPFFCAPMKARLSAVLSVLCPALHAMLFNVYQVYKRILSKKS